LREHRVEHLRDGALLGHGQGFDLLKLLPNLRKRHAKLSITHKLSAELKADRDIRQTRHATPDDGVAGWRIVGTVKVTDRAARRNQFLCLCRGESH